jgi:hypothetical protein
VRRPAGSRIPSLVRYGLATIAVATAVGWGVNRWVVDNPIGFSHYTASAVDWNARREAVKETFAASWQAYTQYAWGEFTSHSIWHTHNLKTLTAAQVKTGTTPSRHGARR